MRLDEIQTSIKLLYVPNSTRDQFDKLLFDLEPNAESYEDISVFAQQHPNAQKIMAIFTNPSEDYRGDLGSSFYRELSVNTGHVYSRKLPEPDIFIWQTSNGRFFLQDNINDPSDTAEISELLLRRIQKCAMEVTSPREVQHLIDTDH